MLFIHTLEKVLSGEKSQTRRIVKPGQYGCLGTAQGYTMVAAESGRWVYQVGKDYAVCPGRGKPAVARIQITDIRREDVRGISDEDVKAEGFENYRNYLTLWIRMYDKQWWMPKKNDNLALSFCLHRHMVGFSQLMERPAERYQAWALTFRLVK